MGQFHIHVQVKHVRGTAEEQVRLHNPGLQSEKVKPQNPWLQKLVEVMAARETPSLTGEFTGETHGVLECTQTHPPENRHLKGPVCLWVVEEVTKSGSRAKQAALFSL